MTTYLCMLGRVSPHRQARQPHWRHYYRQFVLFLLLFGLFALNSCYWLKYDKLMRTHIDLMLAMATKMNHLLEDQQTITPTMMDEFSYPLERARDFVRIVSPRYAERQSLQAFTNFLNVYAALVQEFDRLRVLNEDAQNFHERVTALRQRGERVKAILAEEA